MRQAVFSGSSSRCSKPSTESSNPPRSAGMSSVFQGFSYWSWTKPGAICSEFAFREDLSQRFAAYLARIGLAVSSAPWMVQSRSAWPAYPLLTMRM